MKKLALLLPLALALALAACGASDAPPPAAGSSMAKAAVDQPAQPTAPQSANDLFAAKMDQVLAGAWRSPENKARDQYRHPKQTLAFFGIKPADTVIEITPGGGWYTEILAPLLKGSGHYVAAVAKPNKPASETATDKSALQKKIEGDPAEYGEATTTVFEQAKPSFGPAASADVVLTFRNVHNWVMGDNEDNAVVAPAMFKGFFDVLKPGGTLGIVDHRAAAGADFAKIKESGYLPTDMVIKLATDAGFKLADQSEINANPKDTKDYAKGVWTLPPTLTLKEQDRDKYLAIGESDRMTLKFVKPQGDGIFKQAEPAAAKP